MADHYRLADYPTLDAFLAREPVATVAVPIDEIGTVHAAALGFWHSGDPLAFYFVTGRDTEKCRLLTQVPSVPAACVVGATKGIAFTLQMRGQLSIVPPADYPQEVEGYYAKRGNRKDNVDDPGKVLLRFVPNWARFRDYSKSYDGIFLDLA